MQARQRTFDLVPDTLAKPVFQHPPMTSKAAKKAYQAAQRGPKISRAEQRRRDAAELEKQKREHERERAAAKAKAVRDKKAAKENAEREARKKLRLPEPNRFVRASQSRISAFVRSENGKRIWQEMDSVAEDSDTTICDMKREEEPPAKRVSVDDSEDEFGDFPSLSQTDLLEKLEKGLSPIVEACSNAETPWKLSPAQVLPINSPAQDLPELPRPKQYNDSKIDDAQDWTDMVTTQLLSEAAEAAARSDAAEAPIKSPQLKTSIISSYINTPIVRSTVNNSQSPKRNDNTPTALRPALRDMPPPNFLPKKERSISFAREDPKPFSLIQANKISKLLPNIPPSGTQAFLENHFDDFYPSPTQQVRELLDDFDDDDLPSNTQIARELSPVKSLSPSPSPDILQHLPQEEGREEYHLPALRNPAHEEQFEDLISTQDFILSSQDLLDIVTPIRVPPEPHLDSRTFQHQQIQREKRRFFEEKEEDILEAALHESKMMASAAKEAQKMPHETPKGTLKSIQSASIDFEDDSFEETEGTHLLAAGTKEVHKVQLKEKQEETPKRCLKRVQSTATDYGDDDFGDVEQELLAMC